jgi:hypothetical protein
MDDKFQKELPDFPITSPLKNRKKNIAIGDLEDEIDRTLSYLIYRKKMIDEMWEEEYRSKAKERYNKGSSDKKRTSDGKRTGSPSIISNHPNSPKNRSPNGSMSPRYPSSPSTPRSNSPSPHYNPRSNSPSPPSPSYKQRSSPRTGSPSFPNNKSPISPRNSSPSSSFKQRTFSSNNTEVCVLIKFYYMIILTIAAKKRENLCNGKDKVSRDRKTKRES